MKKQILCVAIAIALVVPIEAQTQPIFREKVSTFCKKASSSVVNTLQDCLLAYTIAMSNVLAHEVGHSLASKVCYGTRGEIGIGGGYTDPTLVTIPYANIKLKGLKPYRGYCGVARGHGRKDHYLKNMAIAAAGPLFGILANFISLKILKKNAPNKYPISRAVCYLMLILNMLSAEGSDGQQFIDSYRKYKSFKEEQAQ